MVTRTDAVLLTVVTGGVAVLHHAVGLVLALRWRDLVVLMLSAAVLVVGLSLRSWARRTYLSVPSSGFVERTARRN